MIITDSYVGNTQPHQYSRRNGGVRDAWILFCMKCQRTVYKIKIFYQNIKVINSTVKYEN